MTLAVTPGTRLYSAVCTTEFVVVKAAQTELDLTIGGLPPSSAAGVAGAVVDGHAGGTLIGKRYADENNVVELLCTRAGDGVPALDGTPLRRCDTKPLPASD